MSSLLPGTGGRDEPQRVNCASSTCLGERALPVCCGRSNRSAQGPVMAARRRSQPTVFDPKWTYDSVSGLEREGYRLVRMRISTNAPTATAYFSMVVSVGRVHTPLSRRETTLFVVHILAATSSCVIPAAVRAATRSATSICNVRSDLNVRARRFLRPRSSCSDARFLART
jgi:hypothetical protein